MKLLLALLFCCVFLAGCNSEETGSSDAGDVSTIGEAITHQVCSLNEDSDAEAYVGIDQSLDPVLIDSVYGPIDAIYELELTTDEELTVAFATGFLTGVVLIDAFANLYTIYDCHLETYELNQCNWTQQGLDETEPDIVVSTEFGNDNSYTTTVFEGEERLLEIAGQLGDLGNGQLSLYEQGTLVSSRTYSRTANGGETVSWEGSDDASTYSYTMSEAADCSGSVDFSETTDDGIVTLTADWVFNNGVATGSLDYQDTSVPDSISLEY